MLKLRPATVSEAGSADGSEQELVIELEGARHPAIADVGLVGRCEAGDEVIVNVQARDLGLGSGGFDIVHVNLTRGLSGDGVAGASVMKLPTPLEHAAISSQRSGPVKTPMPKSSVTVNRPLLTAVAALVTKTPCCVPPVSAS